MRKGNGQQVREGDRGSHGRRGRGAVAADVSGHSGNGTADVNGADDDAAAVGGGKGRSRHGGGRTDDGATRGHGRTARRRRQVIDRQNHEEVAGEVVLERRGLEDAGWGEGGSGAASSSGDGGVAEFEGEWVRS